MPDHGSAPTKVQVGDFIVDRDDERLIGSSGPIKLGNKAFQLLSLFVNQPGKLITKDAIFSSVWDGTFVSESALTSTIKELRRALGDLSRQPSYIESVYGRGYRLIAPVGPAPVTTTSTSNRPVTQPTLRSPASDDPPVIIVSEFNDAAVRQAMPYLGAGLREEVLLSLAQFREIQLVANSHFNEQDPQLAAPDRSYHLTATLLPDRGNAKIIARTKRISDGRVLWAENMLLADTGSAEGVDRIVKRIAASLLPAVDQDLIVSVGRHGNSVFDRYLIAKQTIWNLRSFDDAKSAAEELEAIIAERPDFALAYGPLARLYNSDYYFTAIGASDVKLRARAMSLARAGLNADPNHAHNYSVMGWCLLRARQFDQAEDYFNQTLTRNPYNYNRLDEVGTAMIFLGHLDRARDLVAMCHDMAPWDTHIQLEDEGLLHLLDGNFEAASAALSAMTEPGPFSELHLSLANGELGRSDANLHLDSWLAKIRRNWTGDTKPDLPAIAMWLRDSLPFRDDIGASYFKLADKAFAQAEARS